MKLNCANSWFKKPSHRDKDGWRENSPALYCYAKNNPFTAGWLLRSRRWFTCKVSFAQYVQHEHAYELQKNAYKLIKYVETFAQARMHLNMEKMYYVKIG